MGYKKSIVIGVTLILGVILLSYFTYYTSLGLCPSGTFACDNGTICLPQRFICDKVRNCVDGTDENDAECSHLIYGSIQMIKNLYEKAAAINVTRRKNCTLKTYPKPDCRCAWETFLFCGNSSWKTLPQSVPPETTELFLANNSIKLAAKMFAKFDLKYINLQHNNITFVPSNVFANLRKLEKLYLSKNEIAEIPNGVFNGLCSLQQLFLQSNRIHTFPLSVLENLHALEWLNLSNNQLTLAKDQFPTLKSLLELILDSNAMEEIHENLFSNLNHLHYLSLNNNFIKVIHPHAFLKLNDLRELRIENNLLKILPANVFASLVALDALYLGFNDIQISDTFMNNLNISYLNLDRIDYDNIDFKSLLTLSQLHQVVYHKFYFCSETPNVKICRPNTDGVSSYEDLLTKPALRYSAWVMAVFTCLGNALVLWGRFTFHDENHTCSMVIRNLAVADILMGFYLGIIGIQDWRYREIYHTVAQHWVTSWSCTAIGVLAMISSEVSIFILAFMSVERFLLIADPFGGHIRLTTRNVVMCLFSIWLIGAAIAIIPAIHWHSSTRFYGFYSGTCFPLMLQERFPLGWQYSAFVFLGINMVLLILIATLYTALLISIWRTRRATPLAMLDCEFAVRFFFIVLTDSFCWAPIITWKILAFMSVEISADIYAWLVVFVLPLNSAVNPLLYTFTTPKYRMQIRKKRWYNNDSVVIKRKKENLVNSNQDESQGKILPLLYTSEQKSSWKM